MLGSNLLPLCNLYMKNLDSWINSMAENITFLIVELIQLPRSLMQKLCYNIEARLCIIFMHSFLKLKCVFHLQY